MSYGNPVITVRFEWAGVHRWPNAVGDHEYLRHHHRHLFKGEAHIEVFHDDREIEFLAVKDYIETLTVGYKNLNDHSCEWVARDIIEHLKLTYGDERDISVHISEDGENGASLKWHGSQEALELG